MGRGKPAVIGVTFLSTQTEGVIGMDSDTQISIGIIGAGASGLIALIQLKEAGYSNVTCLEKAPELGGTWRENRYPGLTCDVPSHAYRFSFAPNAEWTQTCAPGQEIQDYLKKTAAEFGVADQIVYDSEIAEARYEGGKWHLATKNGASYEFDVVITATGVLHHPVYPDIPGLEDFEGEAFHSARWRDEVELEGKRVGIIGTGSTATQIVVALADVAEHVTVFQRTAQWVFPLQNRQISEELRELYRSDPGAMEAEYEKLIRRFNFHFAAAIVGENEEAYQKLVEGCESYLATVEDPELRARLTPDYRVGCKRLIMSDQFYEAMQKPNVELVTEKIERFTKAGIQTADGTEHAFDVIVLATGFDTHRFFRPMKVFGEDGLDLYEAWKERNEGYMTVSVPGFPNLFMIGGPSSPIGNFSWLLTAETQVDYILQLLEPLREGRAHAIVPKPEATAAFNQEVRNRLPDTVWVTGCTSWYIDKNGSVASWPWTFEKFQDDLKAPNWDDFILS